MNLIRRSIIGLACFWLNISLPAHAGPPTFRKDIAPILYANCVGCHRPNEAAPFSLITYADAKAHAKSIQEVTASKIMPPWLPDPKINHFLGERFLTAEQINTVADWAENGALEGNDGDLPRLPDATPDWILGEPDLIVTLPEAFLLQADGSDVYKNFVIPIPIPTNQWIETYEFHPGSPKNVHHAFLRFDRTPGSREADARDPGPGFSGIHTPNTASTPDGFFSSWQPGRRVMHRTDGLAWLLRTNTDLVLQLHLNPSGKPEKVQPSVGFYYSKKPPVAFPLKTWLSSYEIDIPPGATNYVITNSYTLPADATLLAILPHAHYTAARIEVTHVENGRARPLLSIPRWDFNWQGDYVYREPISLKKGSTLSMTIAYDNSAHNPRNPSNPPNRVQYGLNSTNEMGEVWFQLLPKDAAGAQAYQADYSTRIYQDTILYNEFLLRSNPRDAVALAEMGMGWMALKDLDKAERYFLDSIKANPSGDLAYYYSALLQIQKADLPKAYAALQKATRLNARNFKSQGLFGIVCSKMERFDEAEQHYGAALRLNPADTVAQENLRLLATQRSEAATRLKK